MQPQSIYQLQVPEDLQPFAALAVNRLGYLHPKWCLQIDTSAIVAEASGDESGQLVAREIRHAIYREKILAVTMDMRGDLLRIVSRS